MVATPLGIVWATRERPSDRFYYYAVADKLLVGGELVYMLFFDADQPFHGYPPYAAKRMARVFRTKNGFHAIGTVLGTAFDKQMWWHDWKLEYPDSDYILANLSWLAPASKDELEFIMELAGGDPDRLITSKYYRDKAVFETIGR